MGEGGIFNNRLLLFSSAFSGNFCVGDNAVMEGTKVNIDRDPPVPPLGKP